MTACPFLHASRGQAQALAPNTAPPVLDGPSATKCPLGYGSAATASQPTSKPQEATTSCPFTAASPADTPAETPAVPASTADGAPAAICPYGFSSASSAGPKLSGLHCSLCKQFLHDPCQCQPCSHTFCSFCISRWQDCPVCGRDIEGLEPDAKTAGLVEALLAAHSSEKTLPPEALAQLRSMTGTGAQPVSGSAEQRQSSSAPAPSDGVPGLPATASAFLHLGLQALQGGNPVAALHRLERCKAELLRLCSAPLPPPPPHLPPPSAASSPAPSTSNHPSHLLHPAPGRQPTQAAQAGDQEGCRPDEGCAELSVAVPSGHGPSRPSGQADRQRGPGQSSAPGLGRSDAGALPGQTPGGACPFHHAGSPSSGAQPVGPAAAQLPAAMAGAACAPTHAQADSQQPAPAGPFDFIQLQAPIEVLPSVACALALVYGSQGDCCKGLGNLQAAVGLYTSSARCVRALALAGQEEAVHMLSVTINKLGDCHFLCRAYSAAADAYKEALDVRQSRWLAALGSTGQEGGAQMAVTGGSAMQALDVVACLIKLADAHSAAASSEAAAQHAGPAGALPSGGTQPAVEAAAAADKAEALLGEVQALIGRTGSAGAPETAQPELPAVVLARVSQLQHALRTLREMMGPA